MGYFYERFSKDILNKAYELLGDVTPLSYDCGLLCSRVCCKGGDGDGMLLFPGEREFFDSKEGYKVMTDAEYGYDYVVCTAACERTERPLSCRIFPYFFYVRSDGALTVSPDIRAAEKCPLTGNGIDVSKSFLRRLRMCAKLLETDGETVDFLRRMTEIMTDFGGLEN